MGAWRSACVAAALLVPRGGGATLVCGRIVLGGGGKTDLPAVESRMRLHPGDRLTFEGLDAARARLLASGLFSAASVEVHLPREEAARLMYLDPAVHRAELHVTVVEKHSWVIVPNASLGAGDRAGGIFYSDMNLGGTGTQLLAAGQVGALKSFVFLAYRDPVLVRAPFTYELAGLARVEDVRFFDDHRVVQTVPTRNARAEARFGYAFSSELRALLGTMLDGQTTGSPEYEPVGAAPAGGARCLDGVPVDERGEPLPVPEAYNCARGRLVALQLHAAWDSTRAPEGLREGTLVRFRADAGDSLWGSDFDWTKLDLRIELFGRVGRWHPSLRLDAVLVSPTSGTGVPLSQLIRVGGDDLRGYLQDEFHGDTLVAAQFEQQVRLWRFRRLWGLTLVGATFADAGALIERHPGGRFGAVEPGASRLQLEDFHTGVGAGLRVVLPGVAIPAIRLDYAYGIDVADAAIVLSVARATP